MSESNEGLSMRKALGMAATACDKLQAVLVEAGIDGVHFVANAGGWGNLINAHPQTSLFLPEGADIEAVRAAISPVAEELEKGGVRVNMYSHGQWLK